MRFGRLALALAAVAVLLAAAGYAFLKLDPVGFRTVVFQPVREARYFVAELGPPAGWSDIERLDIPEPRQARIPARAPGDVELAAAVYPPASGTPAPAVVVLHGSYPWGRKAGLMRLLGRRLSEQGWYVIMPDARGFGASGDPDDIHDPKAWETARDLARTIDYLQREPAVDRERMFVFGHSMGANHALEGGLAEPRVRALVLVGPGRYPDGRDVRVPMWERARFAADRRLPEPVSVDALRHAFTLGNIRLLAQDELAQADHKPILLIDGERESASALEYLRELVRGMPGPVEYHTLAGAGHYCGVSSWYGGERVYYQPALFEPFLALVTDFLAARGD